MAVALVKPSNAGMASYPANPMGRDVRGRVKVRITVLPRVSVATATRHICRGTFGRLVLHSLIRLRKPLFNVS